MSEEIRKIRLAALNSLPAMTSARAFSLFAPALLVLSPLAIKGHVMLELDFLSFKIVAVAATVCRESTGLMITDRAVR